MNLLKDIGYYIMMAILIVVGGIALMVVVGFMMLCTAWILGMR